MMYFVCGEICFSEIDSVIMLFFLLKKFLEKKIGEDVIYGIFVEFMDV